MSTMMASKVFPALIPLVDVDSMNNRPDPSNQEVNEDALSPCKEESGPVATFSIAARAIQGSSGGHDDIEDKKDHCLTFVDVYHGRCATSLVSSGFLVALIDHHNISGELLWHRMRTSLRWISHRWKTLGRVHTRLSIASWGCSISWRRALRWVLRRLVELLLHLV